MISEFTLIKNEIQFIGYHILSMIDCIDEFVFYDGNSTDGTTELIEHLAAEHPQGNKIRLFKSKDCTNLKDDYVRLFNELMRECRGDYKAFIHPDMIPVNPEAIANREEWDKIAYSVKMRSFSGDLKTEITKGRKDWWKIFHKNDLGIHYHGHYGANDEDIYFSAITGDEHHIYSRIEDYPYEIADSGLIMNHYCEAKDYDRRYYKMVTCLLNQFPGISTDRAEELAKDHPRVTLKTGDSKFGVFEFQQTQEPLPAIFYDKRAISLTRKFTKERNKCLI